MAIVAWRDVGIALSHYIGGLIKPFAGEIRAKSAYVAGTLVEVIAYTDTAEDRTITGGFFFIEQCDLTKMIQPSVETVKAALATKRPCDLRALFRNDVWEVTLSPLSPQDPESP